MQFFIKIISLIRIILINEASNKILKEAGFTLGYNNGVVTINKNDKAEVMKLLDDMQNTKIPKMKK